jgi:GT2 family glycosyltransferase
VPTSPRDRITTVVISLNRRDDLLRSLPRHPGPVILVDNGSTDGTVEAVRAAYPHVEIIGLASNVGAAARNVGVERASTPYVVFADDDSWWAADARDRLAALFDTYPRLALVAARILVGPQDRLDPASAEMAVSPLPMTHDQPGLPVLGFVACGAAVRRDAFLQVGGFDPVVFFPGEEERVALDLAAAGWDLAYVPEVVAHHHPSVVRSTSSARERLILRNGILTAVMRRPWRVVARRCWASASAGAVGRSALAATVPRLPAALRSRQRIPRELEDRLAILSNK